MQISLCQNGDSCLGPIDKVDGRLTHEALHDVEGYCKDSLIEYE